MTEQQLELVETGHLTVWDPPVPDREGHALACALVSGMHLGATASGVVVIPGEPPAKGRPRARIQTTRAGKSYVQAYTPAETRKAETRIAWHLKRLGTHPTGDLALGIVFYRRTRHRVDIDNLQKAVLDAGNQARVWTDDSQIKALAALLRVDPQEPRTIVALAQIPTPQLEIPS